jgi:hypothetical protein
VIAGAATSQRTATVPAKAPGAVRLSLSHPRGSMGRPSFDACLIASSRIAPTAESGVAGLGVGYTFLEHILGVMSLVVFSFFSVCIMFWGFGAMV